MNKQAFRLAFISGLCDILAVGGLISYGIGLFLCLELGVFLVVFGLSLVFIGSFITYLITPKAEKVPK